MGMIIARLCQLDIVLRALNVLLHLILTATNEVATIMTPTLRKKQLRHETLKEFAPGHPRLVQCIGAVCKVTQKVSVWVSLLGEHKVFAW